MEYVALREKCKACEIPREYGSSSLGVVMGFVAKKMIGGMLLPPALMWELLVVGILLLWFSKRQRLGKVLVTLAGILFVTLGWEEVPDEVLYKLERHYPPLDVAKFDENAAPKWVVVLGGGHSLDAGLPLSSQIAPHSLVRLVEGIMLWRQLPESQLLLSGGTGFTDPPKPVADTMAQVAAALGVPQEAMLLETASRDTEQQAKEVAEIVGTEPFILVTSATHMRRAMALFEHTGLRPIAAPTGHVAREGPWWPSDFFPGATGWWHAREAGYELLGLTWAWLRGKTGGGA